jgi:hypothetical protein
MMKRYINIFLTCGEMAKGPTSSNEGRHVHIMASQGHEPLSIVVEI